MRESAESALSDTLALPSELDRELTALYRAWDSLERARYGNSIIDFDLAPRRSFAAIESREAVLRQLENIDGALERGGIPSPQLIRARLRASITYLRTLLGETINFKSYIANTLAVEPKFFSENEIEQKKSEVDSLLRREGELAFRAADFHRFQTHFLIRNEKRLPQQFAFYRSRWLPELLKRIRVPLNEYAIRVVFASEDAYWKNWISGNLSEHQIELKINTHPRHIWYQGFPETLVLHEYCGHAVQMISWHHGIERKQLPEFVGILTVHFPDQFILEGLAESVAYFLPSDQLQLERKSYVLRELHYYSLLVMNNMHILANEAGNGEAFQYANERLPFTKEVDIQREIRDRTRHPLFRCYQYVYGIAKHSFLRALSELGPREGWALLRMVYDLPMTARRFETTWRELAGRRELGAPRDVADGQRREKGA